MCSGIGRWCSDITASRGRLWDARREEWTSERPKSHRLIAIYCLTATFGDVWFTSDFFLGFTIFGRDLFLRPSCNYQGKKTSLRTPSFHLIGSQDSDPDGCDLRPRGSSTRPSSHCRHDVPADFTLPHQRKTQRPLTLSSQRASLPTFITASRLATHSANGHVVISYGRNEWIIQQVAAPKIHSGATYHHLHCKWSLLRGFKVSVFHPACHNPGAPEHFSLWQLVLGFFFQRKIKAFMFQVLFHSRTPWHMEPLHFIKS